MPQIELNYVLIKNKNYMEKLTEKLNAFAISKSTKDDLIKIAQKEQLYLHQVCRRFLKIAIDAYLNEQKTK